MFEVEFCGAVKFGDAFASQEGHAGEDTGVQLVFQPCTLPFGVKSNRMR